MQWQFWIDRGGTFTDVVARGPDGRLHTAKLLSSDPERYADAAVEAVRHAVMLEPSLKPEAVRFLESIGIKVIAN